MKSPAEAESKSLSRRSFIKGLIGGAVIASTISTEIKEAIADAILPVCRESSPSSLMGKSCSARIESLAEKMGFIGSMRSVGAFQEMATPVAERIEKSKPSFKILYPGAGSHIAPLGLITELMDKNVIEQGEIVMTEIDECAMAELETNLKNLCAAIPEFQLEEYGSGADCSEKGAALTHYLRYKGKPVKINFLLNCSGEEWFKAEDYTSCDLFVSHDTGEAIEWQVRLLLDYIKAAKKSGKSPLIIMEDSTRVFSWLKRTYDRQFDMELMGTMTRGIKPYGHRGLEVRKSKKYDKYMAEDDTCHLKDEGLKPEKLEKRIREIKSWLESGEAPEKSMEVYGELNQAQNKNAVLLELHPGLLEMPIEDIALIMEISLVPNNGAWLGRSGTASERLIKGNPKNSLGKLEPEILLFSRFFLKDVFEKCEGLLEKTHNINPVLARVLAIRTLQCINKLKHELLGTDKEEDLDKIKVAIAPILTYLDKNDQVPGIDVFEKYIDSLKQNFHLAQKWENASKSILDRKSMAEEDYKQRDNLFCEWKKPTLDQFQSQMENCSRRLSERINNLTK